MIYLGAGSDYRSLLCLNQEFHDLLSQEWVFECLARAKFPDQTLLRLDRYNFSWKELLQDDNSKNGYYLIKKNIVAEWKHNTPDRFYVNRVSAVGWDRRINKVFVDIEAYGEDDLRSAFSSRIVRVPRSEREEHHEDYTDEEEEHAIHNFMMPPEDRQGDYGIDITANDPEPDGGDEHGNNPTAIDSALTVARASRIIAQHQVATLHLNPKWFGRDIDEEDHTVDFRFTYAGRTLLGILQRRNMWPSFSSNTDYPSVTIFTLESHENCLSDIFDLRKESVEFVPRFPAQATDVESWDGVTLPQPVLQRYRAGQWGQDA